MKMQHLCLILECLEVNMKQQSEQGLGYKSVQDIKCSKCGVYLFTECDCFDGKVKRLNGGDEVYDEFEGSFYCNDCAKVN